MKTKVPSSRQTAPKRKRVIRWSSLPILPQIEDELTRSSASHSLLEEDAGAKQHASQSESHPAKRKPRQPRLEIPPILFEGDEPEVPGYSGPGEKFSLGPETPAAHFPTTETHLPTSYDTGRLFLAARDPHWIYAYWDINPTVQFQYNARSQDRHLILRMHERDLSSKPAVEIHVHPESRHWFAHVERAGEQYVADLGYYQVGRQWKSVATSALVRTPPASLSADSKVEFATIPAEVPFETMLSLLKEGEEQQLPLAHGIEQLRERRSRDFPPVPPTTAWTPEQERALAEIVATGRGQKALLGSQEITGLPIEGLPAEFSQFNLPSSFEHGSSPLGGDQPPREFWLKVNAELTVYGSTEPNAKVSIGGKEIALQPDGSFSLRFALPDGKYELPIVAVSADGTDARAAELKFSRATGISGDVGVQPEDPALKPPSGEAV
ncbi:MAG TPA: DUF4912 domain-containing protein [Verrucomicrobiae bacterium]|nr:DUF4912 domain-containing protein [Verrucomicrobiae bacterium]